MDIQNRGCRCTGSWQGALAVLAASAVAGAAWCSAAGQTINPVAPVAGGGFSRAAAVNASGTAAAGYSDNAASADRAIRWSNPGGSVSMGLLPGGTFNSYAAAIDASGTILAGSGDSGSSRAFRWTTTGGYQLLPLLPGSGGFNEASGISQSGAVVVGTSGLNSAARAFLWSSASPGSSVNLGVLSGQPSSRAAAVSGDGSTVVGSSGTRAFRWTAAGGMVDLGSLPGQLWALGEAVNSNGTVITGRFSNGSELGYRWTPTGGMVALPQTPAGCTALRPRAVNGDGTLIIGQVVDNSAGFTAFVWTPSQGSQLLTTHLQARGVNLTGWQLTDATGISADGTAMCGNGLYNGSPVGWVVRGLPCATVTGIGWGNPTSCIGGSAGFGSNTSVVVGGIYRWSKDGVPLNDGLQPSGSTLTGTSTTSMSLTNMQPGDAGNYTFTMSSQGACETSLTTAFPGPVNAPNIVVQPGATSACQGQNPGFFCAANTGNGTVTYRWQKLVGAPINAWVDLFDGPSGNGGSYLGTSGTTFSILNAQPADSALYRCALGNTNCGPSPSVYSVAAPMTIAAAAPTVTGPGDSYQCGGDNDAFISVTASPAVGCTFRWQKRVGPTPSSFADIFDGPTGNGGFFSQTNTATLGVYSFSPAEANDYRCRVTGPCGGITYSAPGYLAVPPPAAILASPVGVAQCPGDDDVFLSVTATPGVSYRWQRFTGPPTNTWVNIFDGPNGFGGFYGQTGTATMGVYSLTAGAYTQYRCVVTEACTGTSATSSPASLAPLGAPVIAGQPSGGPVCIGGTTQLAVTLAPGHWGSVSYQWYRYVPAFPIYVPLTSGPLPSGATVSGAQGPTLTVTNFQALDAGQYYCMVSGPCNGGPSQVATLAAVESCSLADIVATTSGPVTCGDGTIDGSDFIAFINSFSIGDPSIDPLADIVDGGGTPPGDGTIDGSDFIAFINAFAAGC